MAGGFSNSKTPKHLRGKWRTPLALFASQDREFRFTADVAAEPHTALCPVFLTKEQDALARFWDDFGGTVWCNPPYDDIMPWVHVAAHCNDRGTGCVMLVPASTSVDWWLEALQSVTEVKFITGGRIKFLHPETGKPQNGNMGGSAFLIWRPDDFPKQARVTWHDRDTLFQNGAAWLAAKDVR